MHGNILSLSLHFLLAPNKSKILCIYPCLVVTNFILVLCTSLLINLTPSRLKGAKDETMYYILNYQHTKIPTPTVSGIGIKLMFWDTSHKKWLVDPDFGKIRLMKLGVFIYSVFYVLSLNTFPWFRSFFIFYCILSYHATLLMETWQQQRMNV